MKYNKIIKKLSLVLVFSTIVLACTDDDSNSYGGPDFAAFLGQDTSIVVSESSDPMEIEFGITEAQSQDVTITLQATDDTAMSGVDYTLSSTSITIPAGEYNGSITISPVDNDVFNLSKTFVLEITDVSASGVEIGNFDVHSYRRTVTISNDDCPSQSDLWWGNLTVEDVGYPNVDGVTGSPNSSGDCDILLVNGDPGAFGINSSFEFYFTPFSEGATAGTIDVPSQIYCEGCSAGLDVYYSAQGTYDEDSQTIVVNYAVTRDDGAGYTGINIITPQ